MHLIHQRPRNFQRLSVVPFHEMKAAITRPRLVEIRDIAKPVPKDNQVLVRVFATTICAADYRLKNAPFLFAWMLGLRKGKVLGMEFSGTVESVGSAVTRFRPGDQVFGGTIKLGSHAQYVCALESHVESKPANMTLDECAAVMFGGLTAFAFLRKAGVQRGQNVLVYGASGSVGVFAIQLAKHFGARVTGVCSTANVDLVKSLGADHVIDYTTTDFANDGPVYDMVFDTVGKSGFARTAKALKRGGTYIRIAPSGSLWSIFADIPRQWWMSLTGAAKVVGGLPPNADGALAALKGLIDAGEVRTVIDRCYPLPQIAEAFRYAEAGHKKGHVVILVE